MYIYGPRLRYFIYKTCLPVYLSIALHAVVVVLLMAKKFRRPLFYIIANALESNLGPLAFQYYCGRPNYFTLNRESIIHSEFLLISVLCLYFFYYICGLFSVFQLII